MDISPNGRSNTIRECEKDQKTSMTKGITLTLPSPPSRTPQTNRPNKRGLVVGDTICVRLGGLRPKDFCFNHSFGFFSVLCFALVLTAAESRHGVYPNMMMNQKQLETGWEDSYENSWQFTLPVEEWLQIRVALRPPLPRSYCDQKDRVIEIMDIVKSLRKYRASRGHAW